MLRTVVVYGDSFLILGDLPFSTFFRNQDERVLATRARNPSLLIRWEIAPCWQLFFDLFVGSAV